MTKPSKNTRHSDLVKVAARWLKNSAVVASPSKSGKTQVRCPIVLTELVTYAQSVPDAIGWHNSGRFSILIEVKVSRSDFLADANKFVRRFPEYGVGRHRYLLAPVGLVSVDDVPELWGLLECDKNKVLVQKLAERQPDEHVNLQEEMVMMASCIRRLRKAAALSGV